MYVCDLSLMQIAIVYGGLIVHTVSSKTLFMSFCLLHAKFRADLNLKLYFGIIFDITLYCEKYNDTEEVCFTLIVYSHMLCIDYMINILLKSHHFLFHL